jgi:hypothetical protein
MCQRFPLSTYFLMAGTHGIPCKNRCRLLQHPISYPTDGGGRGVSFSGCTDDMSGGRNLSVVKPSPPAYITNFNQPRCTIFMKIYDKRDSLVFFTKHLGFSPRNWDIMCSVCTVASHDLTLCNMSVTMSLPREVIVHDSHSQGIFWKSPMFFDPPFPSLASVRSPLSPSNREERLSERGGWWLFCLCEDVVGGGGG